MTGPRPLPTLAELARRHPDAQEIDPATVAAVLADRTAPVEQVLSALHLVPMALHRTADAPARLERPLRLWLADAQRVAAWGRTMVVQQAAGNAWREAWRLLPAAARPGPGPLLAALLAAGEAQGALGDGELVVVEVIAAALADLADAQLAPIADGLARALAERAAPPWRRVHAYLALRALRPLRGPEHRAADPALYAVLADPGEDATVRGQAHLLLARRLPREVHGLQERGLLPWAAVPPFAAIVRFSPYHERAAADEGEWLANAEGHRIADRCRPAELSALLGAAAADPQRAAAAALLAPLVAARVPACAPALAAALAAVGAAPQRITARDGGWSHDRSLGELCRAALAALPR